MSELKPCPFCGGKANFSLGKAGEGEDWHYLECAECEAMGPRVQYAAHNIAIKEAIASAWNTRTPTPDPATIREAALREAAELVRSTAYTSNGDNRSLEPVATGLAGMDMHHATIAAAILAMIGEKK